MVEMKAVGFTGTRKGMSRRQKSLVRYFLQICRPTVVHHGDCIGADAEFHDIVEALDSSIAIHIHPPDDPKARAFKSGDVVWSPKPYLERNLDIAVCCDFLIAAPSQNKEVLRSGTWATVRYARNFGKSVILIHRP